MPSYTKKTFKPRKQYTRKKPVPFTKTQVKAVAKIARKVDFANDETKKLKFTDLALGPTIATPVRSWTLTAFFASGLSDDDMIGRSVHLSHLNLRGQIARGGAGEAAPAIVRMMLIYTDVFVPNTNNMVASDLFEPGTYRQVGGPGVSLGKINTQTSRVLYDKRFVLNSTGDNIKTVSYFTINKKLDRTIKFEAVPGSTSAGDVANPKGNLVFLCVMDAPNNASLANISNPVIQCLGELTYKDA